MSTDDLTIEGLVHDLNNVFQTISDAADMLATDPKWAKLSATLQRSVERGQRISRSIVENNRVESEFSQAVHHAVEFASDYLDAVHGPHLGFNLDVDSAFHVRGDTAQWERILVNLFVNAAEAGARNVSVQAHGEEIVVSDDGRGIAPEVRPVLFQPHVSTKDILSGLGLYVVKSLVEQNGGSVSAENVSGGGAVFRIRV